MATEINKMKICLAIHSLQAGGMERVMSELANYFADNIQVETHLVLYGKGRQIFFPLSDNVIVHKPNFIFNNKYRALSTFKTIFFIRKSIKEINPDTVLSFGEYWNNFVLISMLGLKYPVFVSDRSQPDKSLGLFQDKLRSWLYPTATGIVLQTQKAREVYLRKNKHNNIAVIGNPIREINHWSGEQKEKVVLMVGRLIKSKNQDRLIRIFAKIVAPEWKLMLVGYDHLKQKNMDGLKQLASELGIADRVVFTGKQNNTEQLYSRSSIFAFTSSSEGFPNVIGEAMSAGLPVIAYDCSAGPSDMIDDKESGFLIPLFDDDCFKKKLEQLMNDEILRKNLGVYGQEKIKSFTKDNICRRFYGFITNV